MKNSTFLYLLIVSISVIGCSHNAISLQPGFYEHKGNSNISTNIFQHEGRFCWSTRSSGISENPDRMVQYTVASISLLTTTEKGEKIYKTDKPEGENDYSIIMQRDNNTISINGDDYFKHSSESSDISIPENVQRCLTSEDAFYEAEEGPL